MYVDTLSKMGFKLNKVDRCVANKTIDGQQCTIAWYVDDNKLSHKNPKVVSKILEEIDKVYPGLVISRGKKHTLLGMDIEFIGDGRLTIGTKEYILEAFDTFGENVSQKVTSPANLGLFKIDDNSPLLNPEKSDKFHSVTAKLLWVEKRGRPDIETAISFLCTRVLNPTEQDWKKLRRLLCFLNGTIDDVRVLGADELDSLLTFVDAAYAVHPNMRGHTGGVMSMGTGVVHAKSSKQKINTKSSTDSEVVGTSEYLPYNTNFTMFMEDQGYPIKSNILLQDNESAIKMIQNGRASCTSRSKHIHIRYFFIKDRIDNGEFKVAYCPTEKMLADFFTKPLQGKLFERLRRVIMGWDHVSTLEHEYNLTATQERVGENDSKNNMSDEGTVKENNVSWADVARSPGAKERT